jgi:tetratricopeptide (TPR) repeat protein
VRADEANIRAAFDYAVEVNDNELALEIAAGMGDYWFERGDHELARRSLAKAVSGAGDANARALLWALRHMTRLAVWAGDHEEADRLVARQRELAESLDDRRFLARSLASQSIVEWGRGYYQRARDLLMEAVAAVDAEPTTEVIFWLGQVSFGASWMGDIDTAKVYLQALEDLRSDDEVPALEAVIADARGTMLLQVGDLEPALASFERARSRYEELGMGPNVEDMLQSEAGILVELARYDEAVPLVDQALALARDLKDSRIGARAVLLQGRIATEIGDPESAGQHLMAALSMSRSASDLAGIVLAALGLATLADHNEEFEDVAFLHGVAESVRSGLDVEIPAVARRRVDEELARAAEHLGSEKCDLAWESGRDAGYDWAVSPGGPSVFAEGRSSNLAMAWSMSGRASGGT